MSNLRSKQERRLNLVGAVLIVLTITLITLLALAFHMPGELYMP